ncbi:hypothetical protein MNBD_NITROSPINAE03-658 [hydrothermal vent metagenome]|uniref:Uncharacterized protein n=1 Tax=hydrothermal vent metagenome TaxID=652676 RepID=A0A3B1BY40_9ZZZZ
MEAVILASLAFAGAAPAPAGSTARGEGLMLAQASDTISFSDKEIKDVLAGPKDMMRLNRFGGLLNDFLREQKSAFANAYGHIKNEVALEVENLMNEANVSASERKYEEGFKSLEKAYLMMMDSMNKLTHEE